MSFDFAEMISRLGRYLVSVQITDYLDIVILAFVVYRILLLVRNTKVASLVKGLAAFFVILLLSSVFRLYGIYFILSRMVNVGVLALIILFQPELRRVLEELGSRMGGRNLNFLGLFSHGGSVGALEQAISQTVLACTEMSKTRTGALIVFEGEMVLEDMAQSGTMLDAAVSGELLKNIFFVKAPMHDGAVIVRDGRILAAGCMLPLSKNVNLSKDLGMRHRAGIGMSENSDATVVIVSEETGSISVAIGGMLKRHLKPETLENILRNELMPPEEETEDEKKQKFPLLSRLQAKKGGESEDGK